MFAKVLGRMLKQNSRHESEGLETPSNDFPSAADIFSAISTKMRFTSPKKKLAYFAMIFLALTIPLGFMSNAFILFTLHGLAVLSRFHYRFFSYLGIELSIFMIALTGISHGAAAAVTVGVAHFLISLLITKEPMSIVPGCLVGYIAVGIVAGSVTVANFTLFGVILTAVFNIVTIPYFMYVLRYSVFSQGFFLITHLAFNYYVFSHFGEWGLKLVGA